MTTESKVYDASGNLSHIREVSDDGRTSELYTVRTGLSALIFGERKDCVEIADHNPDGTTTAYEASDSFWDRTFHGGRGREKPIESDEDDYSCLLDEDGELKESVYELLRESFEEANRQLAEERAQQNKPREPEISYFDTRSNIQRKKDFEEAIKKYWNSVELYKIATPNSKDHHRIDQLYSLSLEKILEIENKHDSDWSKAMMIGLIRGGYNNENLDLLLGVLVDYYIKPDNPEDDKTYIMCKRAEELRNELGI